VFNFLEIKKSKTGLIKMLMPEASRLIKNYQLAYEMPDNKGYLNIIATIQKFMDQSLSANMYYDFNKFEENQIPISLLLKEVLYAWKMGVKTLYYIRYKFCDYIWKKK
jgi:ribonucleoside-diphosphate reductase alpha chain